MDKHGIIGGPEYSSKLDHLLLTKKVLPLILFHNQAFLSQGFPYPLTNNISKSDILWQEKRTYIVHRSPIFIIDDFTRNLGKASEKPL